MIRHCHGISVVRLSKILLVAAIALFAALVAFGNLTDYGSNFAFVQHVMTMDTIFPDSAIGYRAMPSPTLHHAAYSLIIAAELLVAVLCGFGAWRMARCLRSDAAAFNRSKGCAVAGLTAGFLLWQVGFMSIGGEWFGMWMSEVWNGVTSAFQFCMLILGVLIYVTRGDD